MARVHNFNPGPGALPLEVIRQVKDELEEYQDSGMSMLGTSHRSKQYDDLHNESIALVRELLNVPDNYHVLWLQAGASMQFSMLPQNLLGEGKSADYILTGIWSKRAIEEAEIVGQAHVAGSSEADEFRFVPKKLDLNPAAQYVHLTSNNTITGTQFFDYPDTGDVPLVADMSSDVMWRPVDVSRFGMIYAGAHKNLGPSGATLVILRDDLLARCNRNLPTLLKYSTHVKHNSMFNTPPTFTIYFVGKVLRLLKRQGGLGAMEKVNYRKGDLFYGCVESSDGFYNCPIAKDDRSIMNAVFHLSDEQLEKQFVEQAKANGFIGLANLPIWGHCRVSMYNSVSVESIEELVGFMKEFMRTRG